MNEGKEGKILIFGAGLLSDAVDDIKQITIRLYRPEAHSFKKGEIIIGEFMDGINIPLIITADTELMTFAELPDEVAREDGFTGALDAFKGMNQYYTDIQMSDTIAVIRFKIATINDIPAIAFNRHQ